MNTNRSITFRQLDKFSIYHLKENFNSDKVRKNNVIDDILNQNSNNVLQNFIFDNFGALKQHIYMFRLNHPIPNNWTSDENNLISIVQEGNTTTFNLAFNSNTNVFSFESNQMESVVFRIPVRLIIQDDIVTIKINKQESQVSKYFNFPVKFLNKVTSEKDILDMIKESLPDGITFIPLDLNRGIKRMWEDDYIDSFYSSFKNDSSTSTETMDEHMLLKEKYPELYESIKHKPINRSMFTILDNQSLIPNFVISPLSGIVSISTYPKSIDAIDELLDMILNFN